MGARRRQGGTVSASAVTAEALQYLERLFGRPDFLGSTLAARAAEGLEPADTIPQSCAVLANDLLSALRRSWKTAVRRAGLAGGPNLAQHHGNNLEGVGVGFARVGSDLLVGLREQVKILGPNAAQIAEGGLRRFVDQAQCPQNFASSCLTELLERGFRTSRSALPYSSDDPAGRPCRRPIAGSQRSRPPYRRGRSCRDSSRGRSCLLPAEAATRVSRGSSAPPGPSGADRGSQLSPRLLGSRSGGPGYWSERCVIVLFATSALLFRRAARTHEMPLTRLK